MGGNGIVAELPVKQTLRVIDISRIAWRFRFVTFGMYLMTVVSVATIPGLIQAAFIERPSVLEFAIMTVLLGLYLFCAWVSWKNLSHINAVVHPQTIPAFVTMIVLSMLTVFTAITKGDIELWATFQVFAILPVLGAILAILSLRRQTVGGLNLNLRDFLTRGFSRVPGPRLPPASKAKATLFLIAGFLWFFGLAFVRNYAEAQHQMQVFGLAIAAGFMFLIRARHNLQPDFQTVVSDDPRPPILFLRLFADDKNVTEGSHAENIFNNLGFIGYGFFDFSLESRLAAHFSEFGPFIAVGQPKDKALI
jgi:hypothetical protein